MTAVLNFLFCGIVHEHMLYPRIKELREKNDITQKSLADHLHVEQFTYCRYENGTRDVPIKVLISLADYYDVSVDYLLGRSDEDCANVHHIK